MTIPHSRLRELQDRDWTFRLLEELARPGLGDDAREEVASTLAALADPRADEPLIALLESRAAPQLARELAGRVLREHGVAAAPARRQAWWQDGDLLLRRHALASSSHDEAAAIAAIASDPAHALHAEALDAIEWGFEEPEFQGYKIAALTHREAHVRETAARVLVWDEPLAAEEPLLAATRDPATQVAVAALDTLRYYHSQRCLREVAALCHEGAAEVRAAAEATLFELRGEFAEAGLSEANPWFARVAELVDVATAVVDPIERLLGSERPERRRRLTSVPAPEPLGVDELIARYGNLGGAWARRRDGFAHIDWEGFDAGERARVVDFLVGHPDAWLRGAAAPLLARWGCHAALRTLVGDANFMVMKHAMYTLGTAPRDAASAEAAWAHLAEARVSSTHASETLATYVHHAEPAEAIARLEPLVLEDARDSVRYRAVLALEELGARDAIARLAEAVLATPPRITWAVHLPLLSACARLELHPDAARALADVDNLDVQKALETLRIA